MSLIRHFIGVQYNRLRRGRGKKSGEKPFWAVSPAEQFPQYSIGRHTYGRIQLFEANLDVNLTIGDYCSLAEETAFWLGGEHRTDWVTTFPFNTLEQRFKYITGHPTSRGDIVVGSDVWTGWRSTIMSGVTIGHGAVIATGALVTKDVEPYTIVGGVPAKPIRKRFSDEVIAELLDIAWWDWDEEYVDEAVPFLQSSDIEAFIEAVSDGRLGPQREPNEPGIS